MGSGRAQVQVTSIITKTPTRHRGHREDDRESVPILRAPGHKTEDQSINCLEYFPSEGDCILESPRDSDGKGPPKEMVFWLLVRLLGYSEAEAAVMEGVPAGSRLGTHPSGAIFQVCRM